MGVFSETFLDSGRAAPRRLAPAEPGVPFEYLLFAVAIAGAAAGAGAIALGVLRAPTAGLIVGDWYLLTSGLIIVVATGSRRPTILLGVAAATLAAALLYVPLSLAGLAGDAKPYVKASVAAVSALAIALQFAIGFRRGGALRDNRDMAVACFAVALVVTPLMSGWGIQISAIIPQTFDSVALRMDEAFGFRIPAWIDGQIAASPLLNYVVFHVYISISLAMVGYDLITGDTRVWRMTKLMLVSSFLGFVAYFITPTVGVGYFEGYGPSRALPDLMAQTSALAADLPRNAMPSLHTTWGVMIILAATLQSRTGAWRRLVAALYVVYGLLTIVGALSFGDHYLVDCIVALPFAATILLSFEGAAARERAGFAPCFSAGVWLFVMWVVMLRSGGGLISPPFVLAMTAASLAHLLATWVVMRGARGWT